MPLPDFWPAVLKVGYVSIEQLPPYVLRKACEIFGEKCLASSKAMYLLSNGMIIPCVSDLLPFPTETMGKMLEECGKGVYRLRTDIEHEEIERLGQEVFSEQLNACYQRWPKLAWTDLRFLDTEEEDCQSER